MGGDERLIWYWPVFALSSVTSIFNRMYSLNVAYTIKLCIIGMSVMATGLLKIFGSVTDNLSLISHFFALIEFGFIWGVVGLIKQLPVVAYVFRFISAASFCMYFFHRIYYVAVVHVVGSIPLLIGFLVVLPSLVFFSYILQCACDSCCLTIKKWVADSPYFEYHDV